MYIRYNTFYKIIIVYSAKLAKSNNGLPTNKGLFKYLVMLFQAISDSLPPLVTLDDVFTTPRCDKRPGTDSRSILQNKIRDIEKSLGIINS